MESTKELSNLVDGAAPQFCELSDRLWDAPELRWNEFESVSQHMEVVRAAGFTVNEAIGGIPTAFSAESGSGGPVIAILGEYDGLAGLSQESGRAEQRADPNNATGVGHGCGHHLLGAGSLLAATSLARYLKEKQLPGRVRYYGCPAEEAASGKAFMVKAGAFDDVDATVTWHPADFTAVEGIRTTAYCQAYFSFTGAASHAAASPHLGRSALDAAELMNVGVNFLREHMPIDCRVHYAFVDAGGVSPNVVQATARLYYLVRAPDVQGMRNLYRRVVKNAEGAALMTDTQVTVEFDGANAELLHNRVLQKAMYENMVAIGPVDFDDADDRTAQAFLGVRPAASADATTFGVVTSDHGALHMGIAPFDPLAPMPAGGASTDVGDVSWVTPTVQCLVSVAAIGTSIHSWQFVAQGKLPAAHKGMAYAAKVMATTAFELLTDADLLRAAKAEFQQTIARRPYDCPIPDGVVPPPLRSLATR